MPINTSVYQDNQSLKVSAYIVNVYSWIYILGNKAEIM